VHKNFKTQLITRLAIAVGIITLLLIILFGLRFDINKRTETIKETRRELALRFKVVEKAATLKKDREIAQRQKVLLEELLPTSDRLINFSKDITNLAKKNSVDMDFSFGQEVAAIENKPGHISFTITANAALSNWLNFVEALEQMPYFISLSSFNLVAKEDNYRSVINGKVFSQ